MSAVQSVAQALLDSAEGLTSAEVIAETGEPAGAVYVALNMLRSNGYVVRDDEKRQTVADSAALQAIAKGERPAKANGSRRAAPAPESNDDAPTPKRRKAREVSKPKRRPKKTRHVSKRRKKVARKATPPPGRTAARILAERRRQRPRRSRGRGGRLHLHPARGCAALARMPRIVARRA